MTKHVADIFQQEFHRCCRNNGDGLLSGLPRNNTVSIKQLQEALLNENGVERVEAMDSGLVDRQRWWIWDRKQCLLVESGSGHLQW